MNRFEAKTVVVTGGNRGIGLAVAEGFASEGANVVIASVEPQVEEAAAELRKSGANAIGVICDVTSRDAVTALYDRAEEEFGCVDISMQNAGIITIRRVEDLSEDDWSLTTSYVRNDWLIWHQVSVALKCSSTFECVSVRRFGQQDVSPITNTEYAFAALTVLKTRSSGR